MRVKKMFLGAALAAGLFGAASRTSADTITSFTEVQGSTGATDIAAKAQFKVSFSDNGNGTVTFDFKNIGSIQCTIANIYFQDGAWITTPITITNVTSGVNWQVGSTPANPPGASGFTTDLELDTSATNPKPSNGINNFVGPSGTADELKLTFNYVVGKHFADLQSGVASGGLEVAFHVINYADGGSVTFVGSGDTGTPPPTPVPLPSAVWASLPLLGLVAARRKFSLGRVA